MRANKKKYSRHRRSGKKCHCQIMDIILRKKACSMSIRIRTSRATTPNYNLYIRLTAHRDIRAIATQILWQYLLATIRRVSSQRVRNILHEGCLYKQRPMLCIPLTARHRVDQRKWAVEHRGWMQMN